MRLDQKYFSYCREIGIMKENTTHQAALNTLIKAVQDVPSADPDFVKLVSGLTLSSPEVSVRSCVLYHLDIDVDYVVNGRIKNTRINTYAQSGCHDSLHLTEYAGEGNYTVLDDVSSVSYHVFNDENLFTLDGMKSALGGLIEERIPSDFSSWQSKNWEVDAYIVPVMVIILTYKKKEYQMYYNLQNDYYHYEWANNPKLLHKGTGVKILSVVSHIAGVALGALGALNALGSFALDITLLPIVIFIAQLLMIKFTKKTKYEYQRVFLDKPDTKFIMPLILPLVIAGLGLVALVSSLIIVG